MVKTVVGGQGSRLKKHSFVRWRWSASPLVSAGNPGPETAVPSGRQWSTMRFSVL